MPKKRPSPHEVIDLCDDDDDDNDNNGPSTTHNQHQQSLNGVRKRLNLNKKPRGIIKVEVGRRRRGRKLAVDNDDEDEVMVVDRQPEFFVPAAASLPTSNNNDDDNDIQVVGTLNQLRLPHARCNCTDKPFQNDEGFSLRARTAVNKEICDGCYCYVCDIKATDCKSWAKEHCLATDHGPKADYWLQKRNARKQQQRATHTTAASTTATTTAAQPPSFSAFMQALNQQLLDALQPPAQQHRHQQHQAPQPPPKPAGTLAGPGPFPPNCIPAQSCSIVTKCRHCGWYNKFRHHNFCFQRHVESGRRTTQRAALVTRKEINATGHDDWCHACGRVASARDLEKVQGKPYDADSKANSLSRIHLGTRTIPFRLHAHDPRVMSQYLDQWQQNNGKWVYDEGEMEEELFQHRFGPLPLLEMIVESLSNFAENHIPVDGLSSTSSSSSPYADTSNEYSESETEAMLVKNPKDRLLLCDLYDLVPTFGTKGSLRLASSRIVDGDIGATWDKAARKGTLTVRVFLNKSYSITGANAALQRAAMTQFLGSWYGIFPFKLTDLAGRFDAEYADHAYNEMEQLVAPPFNVPWQKRNQYRDSFREPREAFIEQHNEAVAVREESLSLESGEKSSILGGVCTNEVDFAGVMKRFFCEILPDVLCVRPNSGFQHFIEYLDLGVVSTHRNVRKRQSHIVRAHDPNGGYSRDTIGKFTSFLSLQDYASATTDLAGPSKKLHEMTTTFDGLLTHLENLGHASAPHVEGLKVALLPFQEQSLQWALERETTPGGLQAFLCPKLPSVEQPNTEVWYNPIISKCSTTKPHLVRGGIIAEQMGLGKTVISLALILSNPAPSLPASGSPATDIPPSPNTSNGNSFWDPDLNERVLKNTSTTTTRGSVLSRGTLVVCNVSLVGQWIEEAKSKLDDPGLVYSYHGGSRKRDPNVLAQNSIVVTTYETLASDATYHAQKSSESDYVPPCAQVRWWRVICDESHNLRSSANGKSEAVMNLVADHRWLVSGTPVNTSLMDLKNQLVWLGLENVTEMFSAFRETVLVHVGDPQSKGRSNGTDDDTKLKGRKKRSRKRFSTSTEVSQAPSMGHFTFLMRSVMMRHTQNMTYRGTNTTLMSLPPKTERTVKVSFDDQDKAAYKLLEAEALSSYSKFKLTHSKGVSKSYLKLSQLLMPLRTACAGGRIPLDDEETNEDEEGEDEEEEAPRKRKKVKRYSEYAYTSKVNKLIEELESVRDKDPTAKSLVFSQFTSTLKWLQQELPKRGFQYRTLSGDMSMRQRAKALVDFQNDPPTTIFLLSIRAGACGINLTEANHVFLMEPMLNPAIEQQAIGRVHRLGQKREVEIIRFVMKKSVETRIVEMLKKRYIDKKDKASGSSSSTEDLETGSATQAEASIRVGSLTNDKNSLITDEFDLLFGWTQGRKVKTEPNNATYASL